MLLHVHTVIIATHSHQLRLQNPLLILTAATKNFYPTPHCVLHKPTAASTQMTSPTPFPARTRKTWLAIDSPALCAPQP